MYLARHFIFIAITLVRCLISLQLRFFIVWLWDSAIWLSDSINHIFIRPRKVECDCCGWRGNKFFLQTFISGTYIHKSREMCPRCQSLERQRQLVRHMTDSGVLAQQNAMSILDIGPNKVIEEWLEKQGQTNITTVDLRQGVAAIQMDITSMGFKDNVFDIILCSHVLEHVLDDFAAMTEMLRIVKPTGICIIQVPIQVDLFSTQEYYQPREEEFDHVRAYGKDFHSRLISAGFTITHSEKELFELKKPLPN